MNFRSFFARTPRFWTFIAFVLATLEAWSLTKIFLDSPVFPGFISGNAAIWAWLMAISVAMAAAYVIWFELTAGPIEPKAILADIWLVHSARLMAGYFAIMCGWFATVMVYGNTSPLGPDLMRGIRTSEPWFDSSYWPLVFCAGVLAVWWLARQFAAIIKVQTND